MKRHKRMLSVVGPGASVMSVAALLFTAQLLGQTSVPPPAPASQMPKSTKPTRPVGRPMVGIALEGGGALGIAHVGVLQWMYEHHVPVDRITGTSMGALVGALVASGESLSDIAKLTKSDTFSTLFTTKLSLSHASFRRREDRQDMPGALTLGLKGGSVTPGNELITDDHLNAFLAERLTGYNAAALEFDDLPIPFRCVASDLTTLKPNTFRNGSLAFAVRASISIPGVFAPVRYGNDILIDGFITDNLPVDVLRDDFHPDVAISVYLGDSSFSEADAASLASVVGRALSAGSSRNVALTRPLADIEIAPAVTALFTTDYAKADALLKAGYDAAESQRDRLLPLALDDNNWKLYQADIASRRRLPPGRIDEVHVEGPNSQVSLHLAKSAADLAGKPFDPQAAANVVSDIRGEGAYDAYYDTYQKPPSENSANKFTTPQNEGVVIHWRPRYDGPPFLLISPDVVALSSNVTVAELHARFVDENFGGYGSELRSDAQVGYFTRLASEYYRPIASSRFFVQPQLRLLRQPVYIWENQKRISERQLQLAGGGLDVGETISKDLQVALQYRASTVLWQLRDGLDDSPTQHLSGMTESLAGHILYSNRTAELASPKGTRFDLTVGRLFQTTASEHAPFVLLKAKQTFTLAHLNLLSLSVDANSYFRHNVPDPLRFTLGGPLRLYASSIDEYRGTDAILTQAAYLRRIATLPTGLGQGVYVVTGYEAGNIWSPEKAAFLRQDAFGGLLLSTPLGAITLGGALGDAGHRKVFFTFGKLF
ncbi:patatin-like phospholipase family protein [Granulicella arctica]|uniref:patatin-like phospholipase family protein n=1 Tax=Granulicella arctica TaxID=940613 RepID=UPI0021DFC1FA|nr:patatin-like phospholipase family protein [Granulicella arctica]